MRTPHRKEESLPPGQRKVFLFLIFFLKKGYCAIRNPQRFHYTSWFLVKVANRRGICKRYPTPSFKGKYRELRFVFSSNRTENVEQLGTEHRRDHPHLLLGQEAGLLCAHSNASENDTAEPGMSPLLKANKCGFTVQTTLPARHSICQHSKKQVRAKEHCPHYGKRANLQ